MKLYALILILTGSFLLSAADYSLTAIFNPETQEILSTEEAVNLFVDELEMDNESIQVMFHFSVTEKPEYGLVQINSSYYNNDDEQWVTAETFFARDFLQNIQIPVIYFNWDDPEENALFTFSLDRKFCYMMIPGSNQIFAVFRKQ